MPAPYKDHPRQDGGPVPLGAARHTPQVTEQKTPEPGTKGTELAPAPNARAAPAAMAEGEAGAQCIDKPGRLDW